MLSAGTVVFFKDCKIDSHNQTEKIGFHNGHGFALLLGIVPPFGKDPTPEMLKILLGNIGLLSFDDVAEYLGEKQVKICMKKYEEKHTPKESSKLILTPEAPIS